MQKARSVATFPKMNMMFSFRVSTLGIRAGCIHPAEPGEENAFPCRVVRVAEDVASMQVTLCPEGAEGPLLRMELGKDAWSALPDRERLWAAVRPEDLMLLK